MQGVKNPIIFIVIVGFFLASHLGVMGQSREITSADFQKLQSPAEEYLKSAPSIQESLEEAHDEKSGSFTVIAKRRKEVSPPSRERIRSEVSKSGAIKIYFGVRIGEKLYLKAEDSDWQVMLDPVEFGGPIPGATSEAVYSFEGIELISGLEARVYKVKRNSRHGTGVNEKISFTETTYWLDGTGRYLRMLSDARSNQSSRLRTTTTFSYPRSLYIEAPIK